MCELMGVSRASFYRQWEQQAPTEAETALYDAVQRIAVAHRFYGYRRVAVLVQREGYEVGAKKVRRVMQEDNLLAVRRRKFVTTTDSEHGFIVHPNLAEQLVVSDVNQLWVADITYVRLQAEFVYLAVVLDAFSRRAVGWALGRKLLTSLPLAALGERSVRELPEDAEAGRNRCPSLSEHGGTRRLRMLKRELISPSLSRPRWITCTSADGYPQLMFCKLDRSFDHELITLFPAGWGRKQFN